MIDPTSLSRLKPADVVYLSPDAETAALSCAGGMLAHRERGRRVLIVILFGGEGDAAPAVGPTARIGADRLAVGLPHARLRSPAHGRCETSLFGRLPEDDEVLVHLCHWLGEMARRTQLRQVYAPLGVFGHIDHRLAHEAVSATFEAGAGRDVFFYEERPWALREGAVRVRLAQLGARLPPAVTAPLDGSGLVSLVTGVLGDPVVRRHQAGVWDAVRSAGRTVRQWREARSWRPHRAFGLRLQPILQETPAAALRLIDEGCRELPGVSPFGAADRLETLARRHARRLGCAGPTERYWLRLPTRDET